MCIRDRAEAEYPVDGFLYSSPGFISTDVAKLTQHNTWLRGRLSLPVRCEDSGRLISLSGGASYVAKTQLWVVPLSGGFKASGDLTASNPDCNVLAFELRGVIKSNATLTGAKNWELKDFYKDVPVSYTHLSLSCLLMPQQKSRSPYRGRWRAASMSRLIRRTAPTFSGGTT